MNGAMGTVATILGGVMCVIGVSISLRGYWRSRRTDKLDYRAYLQGMFFVLAGVGLLALSDYLKGM